MLADMLDAIPSVCGKPGRPQKWSNKCHADKGYNYPRCREACRQRSILPRIARKGIESKEKLGRHRWVVERAFARLNSFRRLTIRYERRADIHHALTTLACSLICLRALYQSF
jgi:IS5 family transposase